jgi:glycosyltransferase involved in cell wall biosynthesis
MCVRNEEAHIRRALTDLTSQGIDVVVIDHESTDRTASICREFLGRGVLGIERLAWEGTYDQTAQLQAKARVIEQLPHDWVVHADADEWMHTRLAGESLLQGITRLDAAGYNAINFDEFVFLPAPDGDAPADCKRELLHYYFFEPRPLRLMRAWKRSSGLSNLPSGGHRLTGSGIMLAPESFVLRHYMVLSQEHAVAKYAGRLFAHRDLEKGWHGNRMDLSAERLRLPDPSRLKQLRDWVSVDLDRSEPKALHYWEWPATPRARLLACVYTCDAHAALLDRFHRSAIGSALRDCAAQVIEVHADAALEQPRFDGRQLWVNAAESYTQLSVKTWRMIEYCVANFEFDALLKVDVTTVLGELDGPEYEGRKPVDTHALAKFIRTADRAGDYCGFLLHANAGRDGAESWARKKGGSIDYARLFGESPMPPFYSGKCYQIGRRFAEFVATHGEAMAREHAAHFMGAEDLMVGRMHQAFVQERHGRAAVAAAPAADTTVVVTSCGRHDLLERTLQSFVDHNTYRGIERIVVVEDGDGDPSGVCSRFGATLVRPGMRIGQAACIDLAYDRVGTEYVFHLEDDWEFYRPGFIERSKALLAADPSTVVVWLRAWDDTNGHPLSFAADDGSMGVLAAQFGRWWHGFTWNPGLRRMSDYRKLGAYQSHRIPEVAVSGGQHEAAAGVFYHERGYRAVILDREGYVRHIGQGRRVGNH